MSAHKNLWPVTIASVGVRLALLLVLFLSITHLHLNKNTTQSTIAHTSQPPPSSPPPHYDLPSGGRTIFPDHRLIALYGTPNEPALGILGQQPPGESIARVKALAAEYQPLFPERALPTLEIITTVASASPTENNDYSHEVDPASLHPWIDAARHAGAYVVLDLQPGREDFLTQARRYAPLLRQPNVGLALDPEWRLAPDQVPLAQIGSVSIEEINATADWLAGLTRRSALPQKLLLLHQFRTTMIPARETLDTRHPELSVAIQMDGQGEQPTKHDTYAAITADPPPRVRFGWKNFYAKDQPMLTPAETMQLTPRPWYVSYQ